MNRNVPEKSDIEITTTKKVENLVIQQQLWELYSSAFSDADDYCAQDQLCYNKETLSEALADEDYWKMIVSVNGKPAGFFLATNNLIKARIAYCNDRFLRRKFPEHAADGRLYYYTCICIHPDLQKTKAGLKLILTGTKLMYDLGGFPVYDFSENKNPNLTSMIVHAGKILGLEFGSIILDKQVYNILFFKEFGEPY